MPRPLRPEDLLSCSASLRGLARGILHDEHLAEDAVQDAMLAAAKQPPRDEGALGGWVRRVTQRFALRTREKDQGRARRERGAARPEAQPSTEELARSLESRRELIDAVLALDEPYRSMVILRYFEGLDPADIAARRGIPASTVRVRLVRGLKLLRKKLESRFGPEGLHGALLTIAGLPMKTTVCGAAASTAGVSSTGSVAALLAPLTGVLVMKSKLAVAAVLMLVLATVMLWEAGADGGGGDPMDSVAFGEQPVVQGTSPAAGETAIAMDAFAERGHQGVPAEGGVFAGAIELRGGVIDERRLPVEGARVRLLLDGREIQVATTESGGSFSFLLDASRRDDAPACRVHAADGAGRTALGWGSRVVPGDSGAREFDLLRLGPACDLDVRLVESGRTVTGADVVLELGGSLFLRAVSDAEGLVRFRLVPPGDGTIRAWTASLFGEQQVELPLVSGNAVEVEMKPTCTAELAVVDRATGAPVPGALVDVRSTVRAQNGTSSVRHRVPFDAASPTDEMGRTTLRLAPGVDHAVHVRHPGHHMPRNPLVGPFLLVPAGSRQVRLALEPDPTIRFRILPGEVPPPPDGTRLRLVDLSGPPKQRFNGTARIEGPDLVVEGYDQDSERPYARAPDGSLAALITAEGMREHKTSFRRPRSVEVVVKSPDGKPLAGFPVALRPASLNWFQQPPQLTDEHGSTRFEQLYGGTAKVFYGDRHVDGFGITQVPRAIVDLEGGDQRVELTAAPPVEAVLRVRIGGELRLPPDYFLYLRNAWWPPPQEVAAKGEIHVTFRPVDPTAACRIQFTADGFGESFYEVPPGAETRENVFDVALEPRPRLLIEVIPPADAAFDLRIQERYGGGWTPATGRRLKRIRAIGDRPARTLTYEWAFSESFAGPIRIVDVLSGTAGPPIELDPGRPALTASFDLSRAFWLEGRVEAPPGALVEARVVVASEEDPRLQTFGAPVRPGLPIGGDGSFKVRLPGDRPVHVKPWHPSLVRDPRDADVVVTSERTPLLLRLVPGARATFRILRPDPAQFPHLLLHARALLYQGEATGKPLATHPLSEESGLYSFSGFVPDTYTVCLQLPLFAPLVLRNVALRESVTHLGDLTFELGTMLTIQQPKELERRTQGQVNVVSVNGPPFEEWRLLDPGEERILFTGLGPGRYRVSMSFRSGSPGSVSRTIEVDGRTPVTITAER